MPSSTEEILLTLGARDNASDVAGKIDSNFKGMASSVSSALSNINSSMMNLGQVSDNVMQGLSGKSALDNIFGTSSKAETNKVLLNNMTETKKGAEDLYNTVDKVTDSSLTSMQELIPAMKAFKSATGASDKEMINITDDMANFGAAVLAQTGSTDLAQGAMMDLSKGIGGAFAALDQYGITEESLKRTGYWNGDEKDVEGFMKAVSDVTGSTEELMETNQGLDALIGKSFSRAGKKMGNEFLPVLKDIKKGFLDLDDELGGNLTASMLAASGGIEIMNQGFWNISTSVNGIKDLANALGSVKDGAKSAWGMLNNLNKATETTSKLSEGIQIVGDTTDISGELFKTQQVTPEISAAAAHAGAGFGYSGTSTLDEIEKYAGTQKNIEPDALKFLDDAKISNQKVNNAKLDYIKDYESMLSKTNEASKSLDAADDIGDAVEDVAKVGTSVSAAGPEMAAASAGTEAAAAGATSLSAAFTSMIVPLLAISAVIIIMIPIVAVIAAEAMFFLKLMGEFMEAMKFEDINLDGAVNGIKSIAEALAWVGVAMASMTFSSIMTGLAVMTGGFLGITGPLSIAKDALLDASNLLSELSTVTIDPSIPTNLKNISDSLMAVSSAMGALTWTDITTGFSNWISGALGFSSVTEGLDQAKNDIIKASQKLQEFSSLTPLDESVAKNIQNVCDSLSSVGDAMSALRSIRDGQNWDDIFGQLMEGLFRSKGVDIQTALTNVKQDIIDASVALSQFTGLTEIPKDVSTKIKSTSDTLTSVADAMKSLRSLRDDVNWDDWVGGLFGGQNISQSLSQIVTDIRTAATYLSGLSNIADISKDTTGKVKMVSTALGSVSEAVKSMMNLPSMEGFDSSIISTAVTNVRTSAEQLAKLSEVTLDEGATGILGTINSAITSLKDTLTNFSGGFSAPATSIGASIVGGIKSGLSPLTGTVTSSVSTATSSAASAGWTGGVSIGTSTTNGFKSTLNLHTVMSTEMGYVKTAVDNGITAAKTAAEHGAEEVVEAFKSGINVGSPGDIARTMEQELLYTKDFIIGAGYFLKNASYSLAKSIVDSFGNPELSVGDSFNLSNLSGLSTSISHAPIGGGINKSITLLVQEGAVIIDARNKTEQEAKQIGIAILESFDSITDIDVSGG